MKKVTDPEMVRLMANTIRILSVDAIEKAKSGHPGTPMGMAEVSEVLWNRHLKHNPANPAWLDRDRFVLSNGHGSMLIYALLHLTGYDLSMEEIINFRQLHSKTPGHPEFGVTPGVETTTGPLGQGIGNAVGMALAEKLLATEFNVKEDGHRYNLVDHLTYVFVGDGCMMEGVNHEVCSLAGTLRLSKLIAFYDDNGVSIDGDVGGWFADDTPKRFESYGWYVIPDVNGHDSEAIDAAVRAAKAQAKRPDGKPSLICCKTVIGQGAPNKAGSNDVHGAPLGTAEATATRAALGWTLPPFEIPSEVKAAWNGRARGEQYEKEWQEKSEIYRQKFPEKFKEFQRRMRGELPSGFEDRLNGLFTQAANKKDAIATRKASKNALDALAPVLPEFFGGSADLSESNLTRFDNCRTAARDQLGNHLSYGVREFGMVSMMNGMALHGGYIPFGGTFLTFSDYCRSAIRMAAIMKLRTIHVFTHDSIGVGEDGPTHQSIEQIPSLRLIPDVDLWRPADGLETAVAWGCAIERHDGPSILALTRQNLPHLAKDANMSEKIRRGGYILSDMENARAVIIATGSETSLAIEAQAELMKQGLATRVVSMPCTNVFDRQSKEYRSGILPLSLPAVAIEATHPDLWYKYVGRNGAVIGIPTFGVSAPGPVLFEYFGITTRHICEEVCNLLGETYKPAGK